jgi:hypothetical protein
MAARGAYSASGVVEAAAALAEDGLVRVRPGPGFLYVVPQYLDLSKGGPAVFFFRANATIKEGATVTLSAGARVLLVKRYAALRPPEMERLEIDTAEIPEGTAELVLELRRKGEDHV